MPLRGRELAYDKIVTALKGINGAGGYQSNIGGRVLERLILPTDGDPPAFPYICLPYIDTLPEPDHNQHGFVDEWTQWIFLFVEEIKSDAGKAGSARLLMRLRSDVNLAFLNNLTLGGTVQDLSFVAGGTDIAATDAEDFFGEASIPVRLKQWVDAATLAA